MSPKTTVVINMVFVFFIALLSFSVGTFVGKKYSDNQHKLAELEPSDSTNTHSSATASSHQPKTAADHPTPHKEASHEKALSDEEVAKIAQEFAEEEPQPSHSTHSAVAPAAKTMTVSEALAQSEAQQQAEIATQERQPASLPPHPVQYPVGKFTVQVAAYASETEAQNTALELKKKGFAAFYVPAKVKDKMWYRVSVGQFSTQKEAQDHRNEYLEKTGSASAIVQKIVQ